MAGALDGADLIGPKAEVWELCLIGLALPPSRRTTSEGLVTDVCSIIVQENRGLLRIKYPMEHGIVQDWKDMERLWSFIYSKEQLKINSEEHPVLLTEAPLNPLSNRAKAAEVYI